MFERLGVDIKEEFDATTVGGWVIEKLGRIPAPGSSFLFECLRVTVTKANARRVLEVRIRKLEELSGEDDDREGTRSARGGE